jgi:hypothetical protein
MGTADIAMTPEEEARAAQGLMRVSLAYAVVFSFLALRARCEATFPQSEVLS